MKAYVGITDSDWFETLSAIEGIDEVNFWQPGGSRHFRVLSQGELFLFKLHSPHNFIVGGGLFAHSTLLPVSLAWEAFGEKNGTRSLDEMRSRVEKYRRKKTERWEDYTVGCILLEEPFFFEKADWIPVPPDWSGNIVQGKSYDLSVEPGLSLWRSVGERLSREGTSDRSTREEPDRYGEPALVRHRLGQGIFRVQVTDAYNRRCAVTRERTLPVLQAAHIKPFSQGGGHEVSNGMLLRSDLHTLFDRGYVTVDDDHKVLVSRRIREEFENGRDYYSLHGGELNVPGDESMRPMRDHLRWHNENVFLG